MVLDYAKERSILPQSSPVFVIVLYGILNLIKTHGVINSRHFV